MPESPKYHDRPPRPDGLCVRCVEADPACAAEAVTRDGLFCRRCLKHYIAQLNPVPTTYTCSEREAMRISRQMLAASLADKGE
jgi:hypothetical protein